MGESEGCRSVCLFESTPTSTGVERYLAVACDESTRISMYCMDGTKTCEIHAPESILGLQVSPRGMLLVQTCTHQLLGYSRADRDSIQQGFLHRFTILASIDGMNQEYYNERACFSVGSRWLAFPTSMAVEPEHVDRSMLRSAVGLATKVGQLSLQYLYKNKEGDTPTGDIPGNVLVKDIFTKDTLAHFRAHGSRISCMAFSNSGLFLCTASASGTKIKVFRIRRDEKSMKLPYKAELKFILHRGRTSSMITAIAWSACDRCIACSSSRGTTHIFRLCADQTDSNTMMKLHSFENFDAYQDSGIVDVYPMARIHSGGIVDRVSNASEKVSEAFGSDYNTSCRVHPYFLVPKSDLATKDWIQPESNIISQVNLLITSETANCRLYTITEECIPDKEPVIRIDVVKKWDEQKVVEEKKDSSIVSISQPYAISTLDPTSFGFLHRHGPKVWGSNVFQLQRGSL